MAGKKNIEFLYEIGSLRFLERTWRQFFQSPVANDAEHTFRVCWIALLISKEEKVSDEGKILKMALMHDIEETRIPDTNYLSKIYSSRDEAKAIKDMFDGTIFQREFVLLHKELKELKTIEARIVKDADILDVDFEIQEQYYKGNLLKKIWLAKRRNTAKKLFTISAKKIWRDLYEVNPQEWHLKTFNKYNGK
jgi:putative hydrolase of HD superfamily